MSAFFGEQTQHERAQCPAIGEILIGGRAAGAFRCDLDDGHGALGIRHSYTLEWADESVLILPDAALFDPDERFDVEVPIGE